MGNVLFFHSIAGKIEIIRVHLELSQECLNILLSAVAFAPNLCHGDQKAGSGACSLWYYLITGNNSGPFAQAHSISQMEFGVRISPFDQTFRANFCPQSLLMKQDLCSTVSKDSGNVPTLLLVHNLTPSLRLSQRQKRSSGNHQQVQRFEKPS